VCWFWGSVRQYRVKRFAHSDPKVTIVRNKLWWVRVQHSWSVRDHAASWLLEGRSTHRLSKGSEAMLSKGLLRYQLVRDRAGWLEAEGPLSRILVKVLIRNKTIIGVFGRTLAVRNRWQLVQVRKRHFRSSSRVILVKSSLLLWCDQFLFQV
jgi:hypothetical protein